MPCLEVAVEHVAMGDGNWDGEVPDCSELDNDEYIINYIGTVNCSLL